MYKRQVEALITATNGQLRQTQVTGPLGDPVTAQWGILGDGKTAVVEMAAASGLPLLTTEQRNPRITTTFGTGELLRAALDVGLRKIILGIGGSATNDGGVGLAQALGIRFTGDDGAELPYGGAALARLRRDVYKRQTRSYSEIYCGFVSKSSKKSHKRGHWSFSSHKRGHYVP